MSEVLRSDGLTPSERYLKGLCDRSFLSLWSYPNLYLDKAGGQELCDLLVVFGHQVIIFSDKSCSFPDTGDPKLDWSRWLRRSIKKSADQVFGAERWIRSYPNRIFLDRKCTQKFPLNWPPVDEITFHRVVVALGAAERCRAHYGGSGSLMLSPLGNLSDLGEVLPFAVGDIDPERGYVHVLDDVTLDIVLGELDTIADFTSYLSAKEGLVRSGRSLLAAGEEDLLAYYLRNIDLNNQHEIKVPEGASVIAVDEGLWEALSANPQYLAKKQADQVSYVWDRLIESFNKNIAAGTLEIGNDLGIQANEKAVRIMAGEPRVARRMFGDGLMERLRATPQKGASTRVMTTRQRPHVGYVFVLDAQREGEDYEAYRRRRSAKLVSYCRVAKHVQPEFVHVVGIATEPQGSHGSSEDLAYLDATTWNAEDEHAARDLYESGLLKNSARIETTFLEYPSAPGAGQGNPDAARRARNKKKKERQKRDRSRR